MMLSLRRSQLLALPKEVDLFYPILFLYFVTLHADVLSFHLGGLTVRYNNFIAFALASAMILRFRHEIFLMDKRLARALLLLTGSIVLSFCFSAYKKRCAVFMGWYGMTLLCYFWLPYQIMHKLDSRKVLKFYLLSFLFVGLYAMTELMTLFRSHLLIRPHAFTYEPSYYALYMTPFVVMVNWHYLFFRTQDFILVRRLKLWHILFINFLFCLSCSTSAFVTYLLLGIAMVLVIYFSQLRKFKKRVWRFLAGMGGIITLLTMYSSTYIYHILMKILSYRYFLNHHSFHERWRMLKGTWGIFMRHPFIGVGYGAGPSYWYQQWLMGHPSFQHFSQADRILTSATPLKHFESSNVAVEILAALGLGGMVAFSVLLGTFLLLAKKRLHRAWGWSFLISTLMMLVILQINQGVLRTYIWTHLAIACAYFVKAPALSINAQQN